ncbi:MAG: sulfite exporter TauE/SafE family protein [Gammaproteobacteria bacterium]|nr:sulfite exporter TauE/SafE family protein [Gammaproteobacteria bacterium]MCW8910775.1 sulfite exporter TauE/SafE family protein [Gammaproteobacteria bacterium]MCW9004901.1 sulfite exporter TauE/SafE family protein [Gammaproteobacteria bacterium]
MDPITLTLPAALIAGLAFGAGPCNVTCLPYLGPVFLQGEGVKRAWRIVLPFTLGRLCGYTSLGLLAGFAGQALTELLQSSVASWILGIAVILVGLNLLRKKSDLSCHQHNANKSEQPVSFISTSNNNMPEKTMMPGALFMMGTGMALNPCVPLTAILAASAASGSALLGMGLGLTFGIGAVVVPALVFGLLVAHFGAELKQHLGNWAKHIEKASGILLIMLGLVTIAGWVQP